MNLSRTGSRHGCGLRVFDGSWAKRWCLKRCARQSQRDATWVGGAEGEEWEWGGGRLTYAASCCSVVMMGFSSCFLRFFPLPLAALLVPWATCFAFCTAFLMSDPFIFSARIGIICSNHRALAASGQSETGAAQNLGRISVGACLSAAVPVGCTLRQSAMTRQKVAPLQMMFV